MEAAQRQELLLWIALYLTGIFLALIFHDPKPDLYLVFSNETDDEWKSRKQAPSK